MLYESPNPNQLDGDEGMVTEQDGGKNDNNGDAQSAHAPNPEPVVTRQMQLPGPLAKIPALFENNAELNQFGAATVAKIGSLKRWTVNTYKNTKQTVYEHLGKVEKTVDREMDERIESLREMKRRYGEAHALSQQLVGHLEAANATHRGLADAFYHLARREDHIAAELDLQNDTFRLVAKNGEPLLKSLNGMVSALQVITNKAIDDTLQTVEQFEQARLELDVARNELLMAQGKSPAPASPSGEASSGQQSPPPPPMAPAVVLPTASPQTIAELEARCAERRARYDQLKEDIRVKMTLLEEHRWKTMRAQCASLERAFAAHYAEGARLMEGVLAGLARTDNGGSGGVVGSTTGGGMLRQDHSFRDGAFFRPSETDDDVFAMGPHGGGMQQQLSGGVPDGVGGGVPSLNLSSTSTGHQSFGGVGSGSGGLFSPRGPFEVIATTPSPPQTSGATTTGSQSSGQNPAELFSWRGPGAGGNSAVNNNDRQFY